MIYTLSGKGAKYRDMRRAGMFDDVWSIVRGYSFSGTKRVPELSPDDDLFSDYNSWRYNHSWDGNKFRNEYLPRFLNDVNSSEARNALNKLVKADKDGKNIALLCYCDDETLCHRSIVAGILQNAGVQVETETGLDYSEYGRMFEDKYPRTPYRRDVNVVNNNVAMNDNRVNNNRNMNAANVEAPVRSSPRPAVVVNRPLPRVEIIEPVNPSDLDIFMD